jgi:DNA polymerase/3'-5' exonuclease PolX
MHYNSAIIIANQTFTKLQPHCAIIHIAGSIRRQAVEVGDIEIVCIPKVDVTEIKDLFGNILVTEESAHGFENAVASLGNVIKGKPTGRYMQIALHEGINLDLFMPEPADYFRQLAIRTGSADYSYKVIARSWRKLGWVGTSDGLRRASECVEKKNGEKSYWKCTVSNPTLPPIWNSEHEFFEWLETPFLEPKYRFTDNVRM